MLMRRRAMRGDERGAALVEMALVIPILLLLLFNVADAGWALSQQNAIRGAAREAARVAATQDMSDEDIAAAICSDIHRVNGPDVSIKIEPAGTGFGRVTVTYGNYKTLSSAPWSLMQSISSIGSSLEFRISGTNVNPAWLTSSKSGTCA